MLASLSFGLRSDAQTTQSTEPTASSAAALVALAASFGAAGYAISRFQAKQTEPRVSEADLITRNLVFSAKEAIFVMSEAGAIHSLNPAAERLFGYSEGQIRGQNISALIPPPDRSRKRANYIQNPGSHELVGVRQDGGRFPIETSFSEIELGGKGLFSLIIRDISHTRQKSEEIDSRKAFLSDVLREAATILFATDHEGTIVQFNQTCENLTDFSFGEIRNQKIWDIVAAPADVESFKQDFLGLFAGPFPLQRNSIWAARDYSHKTLALTYTAIKDEWGRPKFLIGAGHQLVANHRDLDSQSCHNQKMEAVGRFAGGLAHDFNNLLTAITGYSGLLLGSLEEANPLRKDVEEIQKASDRGSVITRQLLAVSRRQVLKPVDFDLNEVLNDMEMLIRRILGDRIGIEFDLTPQKTMLHADQGQIEQAIINIVVNAREAMPGGGKVSISTQFFSLPHGDSEVDQPLAPGSYFCLKLSDNGRGMDEETLQHIFEPFFTTKEPSKGAGMGLATVYGIIRQSEGALKITSRPGSGSSVFVYLPTAETLTRRRRPEKTVLQIVPTGSETILLVESDFTLRQTLSKGLARFGYRIIEASSGAEAREISREWEGRIHLLIADALMPNVGGPDLARTIRMQRSDTKVLYVSSEPEESVIRYGLSLGNTYLVSDAFDGEHFAQRVREVLDTKSMSMGA